MLITRIRLLVAALWAGSLWTIGYMVAPTLFATLGDRVLAGTIAGSMFRIEAWVSIACALAMLLLIMLGKNADASLFSSSAAKSDAKARRTLIVIVLIMLLCTVASHFGLQPSMAALRAAAGPGGVMDEVAKSQFGTLHGISSGIYLLQSLLAVWLVVKQ